MLFIELPSGRRLSYVKPRICENRYGGEGISYMGLTSQKKWERIETYGPKLVENITQAISRDILANAMRNLSFHDIVGHIHDELIIEAPADEAERVKDLLRRCMEGVVTLDVPLRADVSMGRDWRACK